MMQSSEAERGGVDPEIEERREKRPSYMFQSAPSPAKCSTEASELFESAVFQESRFIFRKSPHVFAGTLEVT